MTSTSTGEQSTALRLSNITKRFGSLIANDDISMTLKRGEIRGLLGENGAGKTTLMNILFGHYVADQGAIEVFGQRLPAGNPKAALRAGIGMVHQHFALAENLTVLDNIVLGTESLWTLRSNRTQARQKILQLGEDFGLQVSPEATVASLSVGEKQRVEILKALYRNARILILDEPTAVLTPQEAAALFETLKRFVAKGLSIIFISHKLDEIRAACHNVTVLRAGRNVAERVVGDFDKHQLAALMLGREVSKFKAESLPRGKMVLQLTKATAKRDRLSAEALDLEVCANEIVGIAGVSGNGQSLLADIVSGLAQLTSGTLVINGNQQANPSPLAIVAQGVARIPEDRHAEGLVGDMTIAENLIAEQLRTTFSKSGLINWGRAKTFADRIIAEYEVKCPGPEARAGSLSGGNMQKLILGRVMANAPILILANQPTRGLDVGAVAYVHEQLLDARKRGAAILLISEDLDELLSLSDRVAVMFRGQLSRPVARADVTIEKLGLMMAGQGVQHAA